jgi:PII-like signaling protein
MSLCGEQVLLRAYLQSADRAPHTPTYERIVQEARKAGLAGATVLRAIMGFGSRGLLEEKAWSLVDRLPVIVEIVDAPERIMRFIEGPLDELMIGGMLTVERAAVLMYRHRRDQQPNELRLGELLQPLSTLPAIQVRGHMTTRQDGVLLRIFLGEDDRTEGKKLHEAIVRKARELSLAGATVLRGSEGFGAHSVVHKASLLEMSTDLPIVIEIVDREDKIQTLLPYLESVVQEGMITMEYVVILLYRHGAQS